MMEMQEVYKHLEDARQALLDEIHALTQEQLDFKPDTNSWSIGQICNHLHITEGLFTGAIKLGLRSNEDCLVEKKPIDLMTDRSRKLKVPDIAKPTDEVLSYDQILDKLSASRTKFLSVLTRLEDPSILHRRCYEHPVLQTLNLFQWVEVLYLHEQRHSAQIQELKKMLSL